MKKNLLKVLSICLAATTLLTTMTACKKEESGSGIDLTGSFTPTTELELTVWNTQGTDYSPKEVLDTDIVAKWLKDKTKTSVVNMYGNGGGQWDTKLSQLAVAEALPEIVYCSAGQGAAHFAKLDELGQAWTLDEEVIKTYAPDLWRRTPAKYWDDLKTEDGRIIGIPFKSAAREEVFPDLDKEEITFIETLTKPNQTDVAFSTTSNFWIRDDVLKMIYPETRSYDEIMALLAEKQAPVGEELLDIPITTTQEFIDFMYKIKDLKLTENGKTVYAFGYEGGDNWTALTYLGADMYGYKTHNYAGTWNAKTQKYEIPLVHDVIKTAAKTQNQMVADKVIDPESLAHTKSQFKEKVLNGRYAIAPIFAVDSADKINAELAARGKSYRFRPFLTQVPAMEEYPAFTSEAKWVDSMCLTKTLSAEEVKQVLNWINVQYTAEFDKVRNWGPEEAGLYVETEDGKLKFKDEKFNQYFIEGDGSAIPEEKDRLGLGGQAGMLLVVPVAVDHYNPMVMHRKLDVKTPRIDKGFKFMSDSPHVTNVKVYPAIAIWEPAYANAEGVTEFWNRRENWEAAFKKAIAAPTNEFDAKWDAAVAEVNEICDVAAMEAACTEIAKGLFENIK